MRKVYILHSPREQSIKITISTPAPSSRTEAERCVSNDAKSDNEKRGKRKADIEMNDSPLLCVPKNRSQSVECEKQSKRGRGRKAGRAGLGDVWEPCKKRRRKTGSKAKG